MCCQAEVFNALLRPIGKRTGVAKNLQERKSKIVNMKNEDEKTICLDRSEEKRIYSYLKYLRNEDKPKYFLLNHQRKEGKLMHFSLDYQRNEKTEFIRS